MDTNTIVRELRNVSRKYEGKKLDTFETDIAAMTKDCADVIEHISNEKDRLVDSILSWWKEHQYDVSDGDYNVYDEDPEFVTIAKKYINSLSN